MKINEWNLEKLREYYANNDNNFIIRIREQDKEKNKNSCEDIVYCEGIKAFYVDNKNSLEDSVTITIPENIYKVNQTNLHNIISSSTCYDFKNELDSYFEYLDKYSIKYKDDLRDKLYLYLCEIENRIDKFVNDQVKLKLELKNYFEISIKNTGKFKFGKVFFDTTKKDVQEQVEIRLYLLNQRLKKLGTGFNLEDVLDQLKKNKNQSESIAFELENMEKLSLFDLTKIEALMILYTTFTLKEEFDLKEDNRSGFAKPEFKYDLKSNDFDYNENNIENFNKNIKTAISEYENSTKVELEKKYQHSFMIKNKLKNYPNLSRVIPFEEEYYTNESNNNSKNNDSDDEKGRIDCIFVHAKENESHIYLVELKVNEGVIGEPYDLKKHGINKHLKDIKELLNSEGKLDLNNFLENIKNRYNYRNELLGYHSKINDIKDCVLHFWIVCAIKGDSTTAKKVWDKIQELKKDTTYIPVGFLDKGEGCLTSQDGKKCDLKLLFDICEDDENNDTKLLSIEEFKEFYDLK